MRLSLWRVAAGFGRHIRPTAVAIAVALAAWPTAVLASPPRPQWNPGPPYAPLAPHSSEMNSISDLFWIMLIISGIIFIGVTGAVLVSFVKFSSKPGQPEPKQVFG